MADPFSVTGSAVGVVSLGIQVCRGLVWYIDNVREGKDKAVQISGRMEQLAGLLELMESVISKLDPSTSTAAMQAGIFACADALKKIKNKLLVDNKSGSTFFQRLQNFKQRLSFPFKEGDILYLKDLVESIQQNLNTALLILNM